MSAYDELHIRCYDLTVEAGDEDVHIILREVLRTLETVTPEMVAYQINRGLPEDWARKDFLASIHASPLAPPAGAK